MRFTRDMITHVKELMERHWDVVEIAHRVGLDPDDVRVIIDIVNNLLT